MPGRRHSDFSSSYPRNQGRPGIEVCFGLLQNFLSRTCPFQSFLSRVCIRSLCTETNLSLEAVVQTLRHFEHPWFASFLISSFVAETCSCNHAMPQIVPSLISIIPSSVPLPLNFFFFLNLFPVTFPGSKFYTCQSKPWYLLPSSVPKDFET